MKNTETAHLAATLKQLMQNHGITATTLAKQAGVSMASLSRILNGGVNPSFQHMQKIAGVLQVPLDTFQTEHNYLQDNLSIRAAFVILDTDYTPAEAAKLLENAAQGTWVNCWTEEFVDANTPKPKATAARQVGTKRIEVDLTFPHDMVEDGSITGLLSVLSAAMTSTGARMLDIHIPDVLLRTYPGPTTGIRGIRDGMNKYGRPLLSCTLRPMHGLSPKLYGRAAFEALRGGVDFTCDPTLLHSTPKLHWRERFRYVADAVHTAAAETNELKTHLLNITAPTVDDMLERATTAKELGVYAVLVDSAAIGWGALQSLTDWAQSNDMLVAAMGGRTLHGHMMSEQLEAKLLRLIGADIASIGSPLKGSISQRRYSVGTVRAMRDADMEASSENGTYFAQTYGGLLPCLPAVGGGHNPWHFPRLLDTLGDDMLIQCGGSVMGHPSGSMAGATANRVAIESLVQARNEGQNLSVDGRNVLQRALRYSPELKTALNHWQEGAFLFGVIQGQNASTDNMSAKVETGSRVPTVLRSIKAPPSALGDDEGDK